MRRLSVFLVLASFLGCSSILRRDRLSSTVTTWKGERDMRRLGFTLKYALPMWLIATGAASATTVDFIGIYQLNVNTVSPLSSTALPFSVSATGGPGGVLPSGDFSGEQPSPLQFRFASTLRNGATAYSESVLSFTLDAPTVVSIDGWADLVQGDGGPSEIDVRVSRNNSLPEVIFFTTTDGPWMIHESALLQPGWYTFSYLSEAPGLNSQASAEVLLTIPEPSVLPMIGLGLAGLGCRRRHA